MKIFSPAFHTSYQYNLATAMPDFEWTFHSGVWGRNRPCPSNVRHNTDLPMSAFDVILAHSPPQFYQIKRQMEAHGCDVPIIYICHFGLVGDYEIYGVDGNSYEEFLTELEGHVIVCVSHFMIPQWRFRSKKSLSVVPHFLPEEVIGPPIWSGGDVEFVNVVNDFYQPNRGTGANFWKQLTVPRRLYGGNNLSTDAGNLETIDDFRNAMRHSAAFLWCADNVAMSFAPLEAAALGVPLIAPRKADWPLVITHGQTGLLYDYGNVEECEACCQSVIKNLDLARQLSVAGSYRMRSLFNIATFRRGWLAAILAATE